MRSTRRPTTGSRIFVISECRTTLRSLRSSSRALLRLTSPPASPGPTSVLSPHPSPRLELQPPQTQRVRCFESPLKAHSVTLTSFRSGSTIIAQITATTRSRPTTFPSLFGLVGGASSLKSELLELSVMVMSGVAGAWAVMRMV